jgi:putative Mg2+ transporter-C (MgtC) family protein
MLPSIVLGTEVQFLIGLIFVLAAGFLIGFERGSRGEPAGVRTHTLVCLGSMLFTVLSKNIEGDPARIASTIVTGVGFLGAGIIMHQKGTIHGLTTAASLWFSAALGMAIGYGWYVLSVIGTLAAFLILKLPHIGEHREPSFYSHSMGAPPASQPRKRRGS